MFTSTPPPQPRHAPQAATRLNGGAGTITTAKINIISINTAQSPPKLYTKVLLP